VMSEPQIEEKVAEYLRKSQALEDYWQRPITSEQLQAELDRMAKNTRQPEILHELFEALGNDPSVIAECLARPALAERLLTNWYANDQRIHGEVKQRAETELQANSTIARMKQLSGKYSETELVRSDNGQGKLNRGVGHNVGLNSHEWSETVEKLLVTFNKSESQLLNGRNPAIAGGRPFQSTRPAVAPYQALPVGQLGQLQEDESRYYVTAVIKKT